MRKVMINVACQIIWNIKDGIQKESRRKRSTSPFLSTGPKREAIVHQGFFYVYIYFFRCELGNLIPKVTHFHLFVVFIFLI